MKNIFIIMLFTFITGCNKNMEDLTEQAKQEIIQTEKAFSEMSVSKGMKEAFLHYAADDVVKLGNRRHPVIGKDALRKSLEEDNDTLSVLKWYPVKADAAASGEIGYTYGNWEYSGRDSSGNNVNAYGNYFTVWRKDPNGAWKFTLDGGNTTPPPLD